VIQWWWLAIFGGVGGIIGWSLRDLMAEINERRFWERHLSGEQPLNLRAMLPYRLPGLVGIWRITSVERVEDEAVVRFVWEEEPDDGL